MNNINDFEIENGVLLKYKGEDSYVTVPKGVTAIGESAFFECKSLKKITIPEDVKTIEKEAFCCCRFLEEIVIPEGLTTIGECAFAECQSLKEIVIPEGLTTIEKEVFYNCNHLEKIKIPKNITSIGKSAFDNCYSLKEITIPESVKIIEENAFGCCRAVKEITIPKVITTIEKNTFFLCSSLKEINIPQGVTTIGISAFSNCYSLKKITIPEGVTTIGEDAFTFCPAVIRLKYSNISKEFERSLAKSMCESLFAPNLKLSDLHIDKVKTALCLGYIKNISKTDECSSEIIEEYYKYILNDEYLTETISNKTLKDEKTILNLTLNNLIPSDALDSLIEISMRDNTPNITTILIEYKNKFKGQNEDDFDLGTL